MTPVRLTTEELVDTLELMLDHIQAGDSFEGSFEYHVTGRDEFDVQGAYRIGNRDGQGGMFLIGRTDALPAEAE